MNETAQRELENLKQRQKSIEQQLTALARQLQRLETQFATPVVQPQPEQTAASSLESPALQPRPMTAPPIIRPPVMRSRLEEARACPAPVAPAEFVPGFLQTDEHIGAAPLETESKTPPPAATTHAV